MCFYCMIFILDYIKGTKRIEGVFGRVQWSGSDMGGCCDDADDDDESWLSDICIDFVYCDFGCSFCSFFFVE